VLAVHRSHWPAPVTNVGGRRPSSGTPPDLEPTDEKASSTARVSLLSGAVATSAALKADVCGYADAS
jgi:hypothetical protein